MFQVTILVNAGRTNVVIIRNAPSHQVFLQLEVLDFFFFFPTGLIQCDILEQLLISTTDSLQKRRKRRSDWFHAALDNLLETKRKRWDFIGFFSLD